MNEKNTLSINFNKQLHKAKYNQQTGYYEIEIKAPEEGGIYNLDITYTDLFLNKYEDTQNIQILNKEKTKIESNKVFMWIFDYFDFSVKDIVEIANYEINIDEETNANTIIKVLKRTKAKARDIIAIKKNNKVVYWGKIENIQNENGKKLYEYVLKYITNIFDQNIKLENEELIKTVGIEDFIANAINKNFISNEDEFINKKYLQVIVKTHTKKQTTVTNVENGIYNLHTWMTNCTQKYNITYSISIVNKMLAIVIENKELKKEIVDIKAQAISNYTEIFETSIVSKVIVLTSTKTYILYLLNDRTTTTDMTNKNRADGRVETVYTQKYEDAQQKALDIIKSNSYNHNITFNMFEKYMEIGTPIAIKTLDSTILDTYISSIKITQNKFIEYICGNMRVKFIDKLLQKERKK